MWLTSVIVGILKKGKPANEPESYRVISLECCLLKMATMIVHKRLAEWAESMNLLPDWQNGFRPGYRTLNNAFILRCAIEWAKAEGHPLYVAMVDATNAFPSTDHATLWLKLIEMGAGGPIFDWLRFLYEKMEYCVRHGDETSELFKSLMGLLTGDPASPILWNLFMADLTMPNHADDVQLAHRVMDILAQADDILLFSLSAAGLQVKLDALTSWCSKNFITVNKLKTVILIFGMMPSSGIAPIFYVGVHKLSISEEERYVGVTVQPGLARPFKVHSEKTEASTARYSGHCIFAIQDKTGRLTPTQLKLLYNARVDCHLTHACEVVPDAIDAHVKDLEKIQEWFIRRSLRVGKKAPRIALYTETGLMPLRVRRFVLLDALPSIPPQSERPSLCSPGTDK